jgi:hypothetical protein
MATPPDGALSDDDGEEEEVEEDDDDNNDNDDNDRIELETVYGATNTRQQYTFAEYYKYEGGSSR